MVCRVSTRGPASSARPLATVHLPSWLYACVEAVPQLLLTVQRELAQRHQAVRLLQVCRQARPDLAGREGPHASSGVLVTHGDRHIIPPKKQFTPCSTPSPSGGSLASSEPHNARGVWSLHPSQPRLPREAHTCCVAGPGLDWRCLGRRTCVLQPCSACALERDQRSSSRDDTYLPVCPPDCRGRGTVKPRHSTGGPDSRRRTTHIPAL